MTKKLATAVALAVLAAGFSIPSHAIAGCTPSYTNDAAPKTQELATPIVAPNGDTISLTDPSGAPLEGHYTLPDDPKPTTLVAYFHGYGNRSNSWVCHLQDASITHGAVAFALDYRGTGWTGSASDNRGWFVAEGAQDSVTAAQYFLKRFPTITKVAALGISMGGNASGLAVAQGAQRPDGRPLFDYWVDIEGVTDLAQEYALATAVSPAVATGAHAKEDIEKECGGTPAEAPLCYQALTLVARTQEIATVGLKGVIVVHGIDDGLVPTNQSRELSTLLRARGVAVDQYTAARRNPGDQGDQSGTTFTENIQPVLDPLGLTWPEPFAGHGWEGSDAQLVIATGFEQMWNTLEHANAAPANHEYIVDGETDGGRPQRIV